MKKQKNIVSLLCLTIVWGALVIANIAVPSKNSSESERRKLAQFPELTLDTLKSGSFMSKFETYTQDQFPCRDTFRKVKALTARSLFMQKG